MTTQNTRITHTPGPWAAVNDSLVRGPHGEPVAMTRTHDTYPHDPNHAANARLIALCPRMVEALRALAINVHYEHDGQMDGLYGIGEVRAILAELDGEGTATS